MSIIYYGPNPTIDIQSAQELYEILDILHTQVMDNISEDSPLLSILEDAMRRLESEFEVNP